MLENDLFIHNMVKEANFVNFKNNIISILKKIINKKTKAELKSVTIESTKHLLESLTWYKELKITILKENLCVKSVQPYLSVFSPSRGKYGPKVTPYFNTFHAVRMQVKKDMIITKQSKKTQTRLP